MNGQDKQAYDRGTNIFSPDGRLYQVEYAREAVKRGSASVGIRTPEGVVLAAERRTRSRLIEQDSVEKLHKIEDHVGIASAGHVADARQLIDFARTQAQRTRLRYGQHIGVEELSKALTDHVQEYTQVGGARPFGVALLVGGVEDGEPRLYEADPSGTPYEWQAAAIGGDREAIQSHLEEAYDADLSLDEGIDLAIEALAAGDDEGYEGADLTIATVEADDGQYSHLDVEDIDDRLADLGLHAGDSE